jgi:hypothetical protein
MDDAPETLSRPSLTWRPVRLGPQSPAGRAPWGQGGAGRSTNPDATGPLTSSRHYKIPTAPRAWRTHTAFDAKTATLLYWWRTYITQDRQAPENTPTEPRATYTGPRWWQQAIVSLAWLLTVYFLLLYSVVGTLFALI